MSKSPMFAHAVRYMLLFSAAAFVAVSSSAAFSLDIGSVTEKRTANEATSVRESAEDDTATNAARWKVSVEEWERYEEIMRGEGRYYWAHLDPIFVLGLYADTNEERELWAERIAIQEFELIERLTSLNRVYLTAFRRMYSHMPVIDINQYNAFYGIDKSIRSASGSLSVDTGLAESMGDRYVLFVSPGCTDCDDYYRRIRQQQRFGVNLDIYFIGASDEQIMAWAKSVSLDPVLVRNKVVTLNRNDGTYERYNRPAIPAAFYYAMKTDSVHPIDGMGGVTR